MKKQKFYAVLVLIILANFSCKKIDQLSEAEIPTYDPDLAFTLVDSRIDASDVLSGLSPESEIVVKEDGSLSLIYQGNIFKVDADDVFTLPDFDYDLTDSITDIGYVSVLLNQMILKQGKLEVDMRHDVPEDVIVEFELTNARHRITGDPLAYYATLRPDGSGSVSLKRDYNIRDYDITPQFLDFYINYKARKTSDGSPVVLDKFSFTLTKMKVYYLKGSLGSYDYEVPLDTLKFDVFDRISSGYIWYDDPYLDVVVSNSFGYPVQVGFNVLEAGTKSGGSIPITTNLFDAAVADYPRPNEVGQTRQTTFHLDKTNSNIQDVLYPLMQEIRFNGIGVLNPSSQNGFLTDSSALAIDVTMDLPWSGWGRDLVVWDQFLVDLTSLQDDLKRIKFKVVTENFIPSNVDVQLFFALDDGGLVDGAFTGTILDSLLMGDQRAFIQAPIGPDGRVSNVAKKVLTASMDETRLKNVLENSKKILIRTSVESMDGGPEKVTIYDDYYFDLRLGVEVAPKL